MARKPNLGYGWQWKHRGNPRAEFGLQGFGDLGAVGDPARPTNSSSVRRCSARRACPLDTSSAYDGAVLFGATDGAADTTVRFQPRIRTAAVSRFRHGRRLQRSGLRACPRLHPEHAELRRSDRRVQTGGDAEPEHAAGIGRVDDAVVPQARGGVVGIALRFVLLADRRPERPLPPASTRRRALRCRRASPSPARSRPACRPSR